MDDSNNKVEEKFDFNAPEAPDFGELETDNFDEEFDEELEENELNQQPTWAELKERRTSKKKEGSNPNSDAWIGLAVGIVAIIAALFGYAIGFIPIVIGIYFSFSGRKGTKPKLATAGIVLNIIGLFLWAYAVFGRGLIAG